MTRVLALLVFLFSAVTLTLAEDSGIHAPGDAVGRLETKLEKAKRDAKDAESLFKRGVLSKLEMEQRLWNVIQCEAELASGRLAEAQQEIADLQTGVASGESAKDQLASAKAALKQLSEATEAAKAKRERAELEAAEANVRRQQQLLKVGAAAQSDVDHAREKLAEVKAQKN